MPINRFYIDSPLKKGAIFFLPDEEQMHLKVMRKTIGDVIEIINGKNIYARGIILSLSKSKTEVKISFVEEKKKRSQKLILLQSYTKPAKIDLILEKGTELGVDTFIFFSSKQAEKMYSTKEKRHQSILISSIKQCGRLDLPRIMYEKKIPKLENTHLFFGDLREKALFFPEALKTITPDKSIGFINGPESGFTEEEIALFEKEFHANGISLNTNTLRAETAAICALSFCQIYLKN